MPHPPLPFEGLFVTGTDTGVGKTQVACALLHALAQAEVAAVAMKPVAAGAIRVDGKLVNDDVCALTESSTSAMDPARVNPYCFEEPIAPHLAAAAHGQAIDLAHIQACYQHLRSLSECVIVEGAGGFRVPLGPDYDTKDLAQALRLPVVLVVGMRLGCLNHAILTAESIRTAGLVLGGWVANHIEPGMPRADENVTALAERLGAPMLARVPFDKELAPKRVAARLDPNWTDLIGKVLSR